MLESRQDTVAVLGADNPIGLTLIRELGEKGVPVVAIGSTLEALGCWSLHAMGMAAMPEAPLAQWLPMWIRESGVSSILAITEYHLLQLADLKGKLGNCLVLTPDRDKLDLVLDKLRTLEIARQVGISVPDTWQPRTGEDFAARAAAIEYPVAVKWSDPNRIVARLREHGLALEKVEYAQDAPALLEMLARYDGLDEWPLVQQWCPGEGLGQMLNMHQGRATLRFQHRRLREWPPSGGVSTLSESIPLDQHGEQMELSERLLAAMGWEGPAMVEYRHDSATGKYWLMEVNGRFWGSMPLAYHSGAHFAWEAYRTQALGQGDAAQPRLRRRKARYAVPDFKHILAVLRDGQRPLSDRLRRASVFFVGFLDPRVRYYVWSWRDPMPFFGDMRSILRKALRRNS